MRRSFGRLWAAAGLALAIASGATAQSLQFTDSLQTPVSSYLLGTDTIFLLLQDSNADITAGASNDSTSINVLDIPGFDTEMSIALTETTTPGLFFGPAGGFPMVFATPVSGNGQIEAKDGDPLQALYDPASSPVTLNVTVTLANTPTTGVVRLLDAGLADASLYFLDTDTAVMELDDFDENRNPIAIDMVNVVASVSVGGDAENFMLLETGLNTGIFRGSVNPVAGAATAGNGIIEGTSGATLQVDFTDPEGGQLSSDTAFLIQVSNSTTEITDSGGTPLTTIPLPTSQLFVTVMDADQNLDPVVQETVQVQVTSTITGDTLTLTLSETNGNSGIFRNTVGASVIQTSPANTGNAILETDEGATVTASYQDVVRPADTSQDVLTAQLTPVGALIELVDAAQVPQAFFTAPGDVFMQVNDADQNLSATVADTVQVVMRNTGLVGGDDETRTLTETGDNTGVFLSAALPLVRDPTPTDENGQLEVLQGDQISGTYTDPTDATDQVTDTAAVNVITGSVALFLPSGNAGTDTYLLGEPVVVRVIDLDQNQDPFTAEVLNLVATVTTGETSDQEQLTLTETGLDTSIFESDGVLVSAVDPVTVSNNVLEVSLPATIAVTYTDPSDASDVATAAGTIIPDEQPAITQLTDGAGADVGLFFIAIDQVFVTVTDADQNASATTAETLTVSIADSSTADVETFTLVETGADTGVFRNAAGLPSIVAPITTENGTLETADGAIITASYQDPDSGLVVSDFATMRVTQTASVTALTDSTGADVTAFRIGIDPIHVTVTDLDENISGTVVDVIAGQVTLTNLTNGDVEILTMTETGTATGIFRNTPGLTSALPGTVTTGDGVFTASDGDQVRADYTDDDDITDTSSDLALMQFFSGSTVLITDVFGAQRDNLPLLNALDDGIFVTVSDADQNLNPLVVETVPVTIRHVPASAGEGLFGVTLTETTSSSGVFRNTTAILTEVEPAILDPIFQSFDGALIQATYTDPNDGADVAISNIATLRTTPETALVIIGATPATLVQTTTLVIGAQPAFITVRDRDQDLSATAIDTIQVTLIDLTTGDSVDVTLSETVPDSEGIFTNTVGIQLQIGPNAADGILQTAHFSTFTANYQDPTPGDGSLDFDSCIALLTPTPGVLSLTDGNGTSVNPFLIGVDQVFVTLFDPDQNANGNSVEASDLVTLTSDLGDTEILSLTETSASTSVFRNTLGITIAQAVTSVPGNGVLEVDAGDQIRADYFDYRAPGIGGTAFAISFVELPPATSFTRFTDSFGLIQPSFLIGAGDIFVTVTDSDQNLDNSTADTLVVTITASITNDVETGLLLTETGINTGVFRNTVGFPSEIDVTTLADGVLQVAGASLLTATYIDGDDPTDTSTATATLNVPQVAAAQFAITTDISSLPAFLGATTVFIDTDLVFVVLDDLDQNTDPTTTEVVDISLVGTGPSPDSVVMRLVELGPNSSIFTNDGTSVLPAPVSTNTTGLSNAVDPVNTTDYFLQTFHTEIVQATYVDPDSASDTQTATTEMRVFEDDATIFFSDGSGTPQATFPIAPSDPLDRVFVTVVDLDENLNASTSESIVVTLTDPVTGDIETLVLLETGPDTQTFRNLIGIASQLAAATPGDGILQTGDQSDLLATYQDSEDATDLQTTTATMVVTQGGSIIRLTDQFGNNRSVYNMVPVTSERIFVTVTDPDENKSPIATDSITVVLESLFNGDAETIVLLETGISTGVFRSTSGTISLPGCLPTTDGIVQGADGQTLRATYSDPEDPFDVEFDVATLRNAPSFAAGQLEFILSPATPTPVTTFLIEDPTGIFLRVTDNDENQDPCTTETVDVTITVPVSGDQETVTLTEISSSSGTFVGGTAGLPTVIDPAVLGDDILQVKHPGVLEARYVDNDNISDQATANSNSIMFEEAAACLFLVDLIGTPLTGTYAIGVDRIFVEIADRDQDQDFDVQESINVSLLSTGSLDGVTGFALLETGNHTGVFRNILPIPPELVAGIPSEIATPVSTDATIQTSDGEEVMLTYIDPSDISDVCTDVAVLELRPSTSVASFTDVVGITRTSYSINFDNVFVTVTDPDENQDALVTESVVVEVRSLFGLPATEDVELVTLTEINPAAGVFRNTTNPLPMAVGPAVLGDLILQTADGLDIRATYTDANDVTDVSTSTARTFVASANSTILFTDDSLGGAVFQYFIGGGDIFLEVFDPDENISGTSTQSVVATITVTATGDVESFVLQESDSFSGVVGPALNSNFFRTTTATPINSVLAGGGVPSNGILEVIDGAFLRANYVDNDFPADASQNIQPVFMVTAPTTSSLRILDESLTTATEFLVERQGVIIEVTDTDENGNPSVADSVVVTIEMFDLAFDQETFTATEIGPNAGIFRTAPIPSRRLIPPAASTSNDGVLDAIGDVPGGLGSDFFDVTYQDPSDGTDISTGGALITTQVFATLVYTDAAGTPETTYVIGVDRIFVRLTDFDANASVSVPDTVVVTITDFGTGDFEPVTLTETGNDTGVFFNPTGLPTIFDLTAIPGDGLLQTGDPSSTTAQAEYLDVDEPLDNQFATADLVPLDPNDRDGDGIPNTVETSNGLDPNDPADAVQDNDLDGRINRTELVVDFTDPNDDSDNAPVPIITPAFVNLDPGEIELDGSASFDATTLPPNIGIIGYLWSQVGTTPAVVSFTSINTATTKVVARVAGTYTFQLTVTDADGAQRSGTVDITINDLPPDVNPGPGGSIRVNAAGNVVTPFPLDGSKTTDANGVAPDFPGGETLTYLWTVGPGNEVGAISFDNPTSKTPRILATARTGRAVVRLTVTDTTAPVVQASVADLVLLVHDDVSPAPDRNHVPTANAGLDKVVTAGPGVTATLRGSLSSDQDGDGLVLTPPPPADLAWIYLGGPISGGVSNSTSLDAVATGLSQVGVYRYGLRVRDNHVGGDGPVTSAQDEVVIVAQTATNHVPTAEAGGPYLANPLTQITLDGGASGDADPADVLTFQWTQVAGSATALDDPTTSTPKVTFYSTGVFAYELVVTDLLGNQSIADRADVIVGTTGDNPPVALAGADQIGTVGSPVTLNGTLSQDPEGQTLRFFWTQVGGTQLLLSDRGAAQPTFTPTRGGTYVFELVVDDGKHFSLPSRVTVSVDPPIANAGPDQNRFLGAGGTPITVNLNGTASTDPSPGPQPLSFSWSQVGGPNVTLTDPTVAQPSFSATVPGVYRFLLVVDDGVTQSAQLDLNSQTDAFVQIVVSGASDTTPTARAGADQFVAAGSLVTLDGTASFDADGDGITHLWTQLTGNPLLLSPGAGSSVVSFVPGVGGTAYSFRLTVSDPGGKQGTDTVTVFATGGSTGTGAGNPLPGPASASGSAFEGGGGGGGCAATPLWMKGGIEEHWAQTAVNLLLLLLPLLSALSYRQRSRQLVPAPKRSSQRLHG